MTREEARPATWPADGLEHLGRCPLCGATGRTLLHEGLEDRVFNAAPGQWKLHQCQACRVAYLDPRPNERTIGLAYDAYYTHEEQVDDDPARPGGGFWSDFKQRVLLHYVRHRYRGQHRGFNFLVPVMWVARRQRMACDMAMRYLPRPSPGQTLLDIGCGGGRSMAWARAAGWTCTGVEVDPVAAARARARGFEVVDSCEQLVQFHRRFDAVTLGHVIEHVHHPRSLLSLAHALLAPDGFFWIETPNVDAEGHRAFGPHWRGLEPPRHLQLFHPKLLADLVREAGFDDVRTAPCPLHWESTAPASRRLAVEAGVDPDLLPDAPPNADPARREFITLTASVRSTGGRTG